MKTYTLKSITVRSELRLSVAEELSYENVEQLKARTPSLNDCCIWYDLVWESTDGDQVLRDIFQPIASGQKPALPKVGDTKEFPADNRLEALMRNYVAATKRLALEHWSKKLVA